MESMGRVEGMMKKESAARTTGMMVGVLALALALSACTSDKPPPPAPAPSTGSEFEQGRVPGGGPASEVVSEVVVEEMDLGTVYFDFDSAEIRSDARPTLRENADALKLTRILVTIEGHCDERGDEEYNLALGERRANSVRKYLVSLAVPNSQLRTVSYGEAKPAVRGLDESAWRWNRRAEFSVR
jgi:peptidoglycan-associated lipoprotein